MYALRHASIVRQWLANVPIRVVAVHHDTSVAMIEKTYSKHLDDPTDTLTRPTLLDTASATEPGPANVAPIQTQAAAQG
jgi:hypothetical protein